MSDSHGQADWGECTIATCSVERSIFQYRPSLVANSLFIALFGISMIIHIYQGIRWRQRTFAILMAMGCISEMIGYGGRIMMYNDPWSFTAFIMQIVTITFAPVFFTAAIYIQLYKSILKLSPGSALFKPALYFQIFIPADVISLVLQSVGGAMSSQSNGSSKTGVNIGLAGLSFQVIFLFTFVVLSLLFAWSYRKDVKAGRAATENLDGRFKWFLGFLTLATTLIFVRCSYRIYELSGGYSGSALHSQAEFITLESCMIIIAVYALNIGHPGLVFDPRKSDTTTAGEKDLHRASESSIEV
ncbi:hypothetical protein B0A48_15171 [Cryoendolithus antarcticus]|uniref:Sphingoid long-chain base transporter RSB1 n=1 Tax=Cryoendolithus antarcticus TaxID=1507870 RepID=A0A1V8SI47_9PEZI|nr:hypothetical protein B0A48_15171 [Cryoendolithus antarcticus]